MPVSYRLGAFYFLFFVGAGLWVAYLPPYFAARGLGAAEIAWLLALPQLARIVAPTAWGALADRFGAQRAIVVLGCGAGVVCYSLLPVVSGFAAFAWLMGLTSLVATAALPLVEAITFGVLAGQTGRYGPIRLWGSIGFMLAVFAGGLWLDFRSVHALPYAMLAFVIPALAVGLTLPTPAVHAAPSGPLVINRAAVLLLAAAFFMAVAHGTLYAFFTLHLQRLGYEGSLIGFLWMLGVIGEGGVFLFLPALFRRFALSTILVASAPCGGDRFPALGWAGAWRVGVRGGQAPGAPPLGLSRGARAAAS